MMAGPVAAADHSAPGVPGAPNCEGQTTAYIAQVGQAVGLPGIGQVAAASDISVKELKAIIRAYCNPQIVSATEPTDRGVAVLPGRSVSSAVGSGPR